MDGRGGSTRWFFVRSRRARARRQEKGEYGDDEGAGVSHAHRLLVLGRCILPLGLGAWQDISAPST